MLTKSTSTNGRYCRASSLRRWGTVGPAVTCVNLNGTREAKRLNATQTQFTNVPMARGIVVLSSRTNCFKSQSTLAASLSCMRLSAV